MKNSPNCSYYFFRNILYFLSLIFLLFPSISLPQENIFETLLEYNEEISDESDNYEFFSDLKKNPIDLNKVTTDQLMMIPGMTLSTAFKINEYRNKTRYAELDEMKSEIDIDDDLFLTLKQFVYTDKQIKKEKINFELRSRVINPLEKSKGFIEGKYFNSRLKQYNRFMFNYGEKVNGGLLLEKDSGENKFNDYKSFYVELKDILKLRKIVVGNYQMEFGEGLVFWNPYSLRKGNDVIYPIKKRPRGIIGYKSSFENGGLYGVSVEGGFSSIRYYFFNSQRKIDANESDDGNITSLFDSGLHRSKLELSKRKILQENLFGGRFEFNVNKRGNIGFTHYQTYYNKSFISDKKDIFKFSGDNNNLSSIDMNYYFPNLNIFGEIARSKGGGIGMIAGGVFDFRNAVLGFSFRNYDRNFYSFYGKGFSERNYENKNERGIYLGLSYKINSKFKIYGYFDQFKYLWRTYYVPFPSSGFDEMLRVSYKESSNMKFEIKLRRNIEDTSINVKDLFGNERSIIGKFQRTSYRLQIDRTINKRTMFRWRIESIIESETPEESKYNYDYSDEGVLNYWDLEFVSFKNLIIDLRYSYFTSRNEAISFYQFEKDLPGMLSINRLKGTGNEFYILIKYEIKSIFDCALKYSIVQYPHLNEIGSGDDKIEGNLKQFIGFQIEMNI